MKFCWSTLLVRDLDESIRFYQEIIGLPLAERFQAGPDREIAFLGGGETKIELIWSADQGEIDPGTDISWGFAVESLDAAMAHVREREVPILSGPIQPNPHTRFFYLKDPNGMKIQLVESR